MDKYFKERMDEIELRTEQMTKRKNYESEIDSLEEKLKGLESNYQRLQTTWKSNFEESALKRVDLVVAKEAHAFAEDMLNEKRHLLVEEKRKVDDLHWRVWEEQIKVCDDMGKCIAENDSVSFLNEYPRVLKMQKYAFFASQKSDDAIKQMAAEHPEVEQLTTEIVALETEIKKIEESCSAGELQKVLSEIRELKSSDNYKGGETEKLIEALERSHREKMSLEREIAKLENCEIEVSHFETKLENMSQEESKVFPRIKRGPQCHTSGVRLVNVKKPFKSRLETYENDESQAIKEKDKKLQARKWYEEYARETAVTNEENNSKSFLPVIYQDCSKISEQGVAGIISSENISLPSKFAGLPPHRKTSLQRKDKAEDKDEVENADPDDPPKPKFVSHQKIGAKRKSSDHFLLPVKSRYFDEKSKKQSQLGAGILPFLTPKLNSNSGEKDAVVKADSEKAPKASRKFEPLMATPSIFFKSATETALDNKLEQSDGYDEGPSTSSQNVINVKKIVKFTPKRPSNIGKNPAYRQTKLDDFDNFMLGDNEHIM